MAPNRVSRECGQCVVCIVCMCVCYGEEVRLLCVVPAVLLVALVYVLQQHLASAVAISKNNKVI